MSITDVDICNKAILKVNGNRITAIGEASKEGRACNVFYEQERDALLTEHPWNFAIARQALQELSPVPAFEFSHQYSLPADCLRALYMYNSTEPFKIEGSALLTDDTSVNLVYIKKVTDTSKFSALFTDALATKIAAELAKPIANDRNLEIALLQEYDRKLKMAKRRDGQEGTVDRLFHDTFLGSRQGPWSTDGLFGDNF